MISMEHYRAFYHAALTGSISKAAEILYITQPAASRSIKQLEKNIGTPVFYRSSKGVSMTAEGKILFEYVEKALNFISTAEKRIHDIRNLDTGEIRLGISDTLCKHYLMPYLESFNLKNPRIKISVTNPTTPRTITLLKNSMIDIGIINLPVTDPDLMILPAVSLQDCFVCNEKYSSLANRPVPLEELSQYPLLLLEERSNTRLYLNDYFNKNGCNISPSMELGNIDLLVEFAKIGIGISSVIRNFVEDELKRGELIEVQVNPPIPKRNAGIAYLKNTPLPHASANFIKTLVG